MADVLGVIGFVIFIMCTIALAASITWFVVRISPKPKTNADKAKPAES